MADSSGSLLSVDLANSVAVSNLCTITVGRDSIPTGWDLVGNLGREDIADGAVLVHDTKRLAINLNYTGDGCGTGTKLAYC
jgi:hypothetical protein